MSVCMYVCMYICMYVCMYVHVCIYVCMYVFMYVCTYIHSIVLSSECSDDLKLLQLLEYKILDKACHHALLVLEKSFCPPFYHSKEVTQNVYNMTRSKPLPSIFSITKL